VKDEFLPASKAYRGQEITSWLATPESRTARWVILSAKYGFIEPEHPIYNYDVTFNDPRTGPITDDALRAQAEHQTRWSDHVPLRRFSRVIVHGTDTYLRRTRAAFAGTSAAVVSALSEELVAASTRGSAVAVQDRAGAVGKALSVVPVSVYERLDTNEPEWPVVKVLAKIRHPWGVVSTLAFGLCDYQLGAGGAAEYWASIERLLARNIGIDTAEGLTSFCARLVQQPVSKRLADQKLDRVRRLLRSDIQQWCTDRTLVQLGNDARALWNRLAAAMGQSPMQRP
jgi:hypothetical protein